MEKKEKVEFILEQMRLCIAVKDYIRTQIISKKINTKFFQEEGTEVTTKRKTTCCIEISIWCLACMFPFQHGFVSFNFCVSGIRALTFSLLCDDFSGIEAEVLQPNDPGGPA